VGNSKEVEHVEDLDIDGNIKMTLRANMKKEHAMNYSASDLGQLGAFYE
jgi:hypothetical protein